MLKEKMLLNKIEENTTKRGDPYITLEFVRRNRKVISGKVWDMSKKSYKYQSGVVYEVDAKEKDYNGTMELENMKLTPTKDNPYSYMKAAKVSIKEMKGFIFSIYELITYEPFKDLIVNFLKLKVDDNTFWTQPASMKIHHSYIGGLAYHTYCMLQIGKSIVDLNLYNGINSDILYTAIILHDAGKLYQLSGPIGTDYTIDGNLLGDANIIDSKISEYMITNYIPMDDEYFKILRHCLLATKGSINREYDVKPQTMEAILLQQINRMDSNMAQAQELLEDTADKEKTEYSPYLGTSLYKHRIT